MLWLRGTVTDLRERPCTLYIVRANAFRIGSW
jgi:hypothetical protein